MELSEVSTTLQQVRIKRYPQRYQRSDEKTITCNVQHQTLSLLL